jgi:hypothetical protein
MTMADRVLKIHPTRIPQFLDELVEGLQAANCYLAAARKARPQGESALVVDRKLLDQANAQLERASEAYRRLQNALHLEWHDG